MTTKPTPVMILTAAGTGRELRALLTPESGYRFEGYLDDRSEDPDTRGTLAEWSAPRFAGCSLLAAHGSYRSMRWRGELGSALPDERLATFVAPGARVGPGCSLGAGALVFPGAIVTVDAALGRLAMVYHQAVVSHDCRLGDNVVVSNGAVLSGGVTVGPGTYVGAGATVLERRWIGAGCVIGAGATVFRDVPDHHTVTGFGELRPNRHWYGEPG